MASCRICLLPLALFLLIPYISASCSCYTTNTTNTDGSTGMELYTNHTFIDFRSLSGLNNPPPIVTETQDNGSGNVTMPYFNANDPSGAGTYLSLRTTRLPSFQSSAEIDSTVPAHYASLRARARISGAAGACAGIFYYRNDSSESDIEILTNDPTSVFRASNQPDVGPDGSNVPGASTEEPIVTGSNTTHSTWQDWTTYRLDWTPQKSTWYINGVLVASKIYGIPRGGCNVVLNIWSDGGTWSGNMSEGDVAILDVQWAEWVWNTTGGDNFGCGSGGQTCDIDEEKQVGTPRPSSASRLRAWGCLVMMIALGAMGSAM